MKLVPGILVLLDDLWCSIVAGRWEEEVCEVPISGALVNLLGFGEFRGWLLQRRRCFIFFSNVFNRISKIFIFFIFFFSCPPPGSRDFCMQVARGMLICRLLGSLGVSFICKMQALL